MKRLFLTLIAATLGLITMAQVGTIENVNVAQRTDGTGMVDISFDLTGLETAQYNISIEASFDGGDTYTPIANSFLSGDLEAVSPALGLSIVWDGLGSHPDLLSEEAMLKITADWVGNNGGAFVCGDNVTFTYNGQEVTYGTVQGANGTCWLDRNLGASQVATSSTDSLAYGDLFQWGRGADGHQVRTSGIISTLSNSDTPGHGLFIITSSGNYDWRNPLNDNLWQGVNGTNNPCPAGYRLPTEAEWNAERLSWSAGAFASPLKLPMAGYRDHSGGSLFVVGLGGYYWSSTVSDSVSRFLYSFSSVAGMDSYYRANGSSVRCLKDN